MNSERNIDEFVRLFSLWTGSIYSYIHVLAPLHADAEDIFQETSRTLWEKFGEYRGGPDSGFRAWALRIAQIEVMRHRQRSGRRRLLFDDQLQAALNQTAMAAIDTADRRLELLVDCCAKLPDADRLLLDADTRPGRLSPLSPPKCAVPSMPSIARCGGFIRRCSTVYSGR